MKGMALEGQWGPLIDYIADRMRESMSLRDLITGEKSIQAFLNVYLGLTNLYILTSKEAQTNMDRLDESFTRLFDEEITRKEKDRLLFEIENIKAMLKNYQISLRKNETDNYNEKNIIKGKAPYRYISFEDQERHAYDRETGFLKEPKEDIPGQ